MEGSWEYDPLNNSLVWEGTLAPGESIPLRAALQLADDIPSGTTLHLKAKFYDSQGLVILAEAPIRVGAPWIRLRGDYNRKVAEPGDTVAYTVTLSNEGVISDSTFLTVTIPAGISLISETVTTTQGIFSIGQGNILWAGEIKPNMQTIVSYQGIVNSEYPGVRLATSATAAEAGFRRKIWMVVKVPAHYYFPYISR
jgi:uncharacterized repeat protein (TIGR01451 family)